MRPKMHVTDNYPSNHLLLEEVFNRSNWKVVFRLGLFHWMQRMTKTLNDRHPDHNACVAALSKCLHSEDQTDVKDVKAALKDGRLGDREENCTDEKIDEMERTATKLWKSHRNKHIRVWVHQEATTVAMLESWFNKHKKGNWDCDPGTGLDLFTDDTSKAVNLAKTNAKHVHV